MGEGFKPELVTVQPLTRGIANHTGPTVSSGGGRDGNSRPIEIHVHNEMDGREIQRIVNCIGRHWISGITNCVTQQCSVSINLI
jgi:hypothetical protein